jgi:hypothetical protein
MNTARLLPILASLLVLTPFEPPPAPRSDPLDHRDKFTSNAAPDMWPGLALTRERATGLTPDRCADLRQVETTVHGYRRSWIERADELRQRIVFGSQSTIWGNTMMSTVVRTRAIIRMLVPV